MHRSTPGQAGLGLLRWWSGLPPRDWLSLWWNGRVDGRLQLPATAADGRDQVSTPQLVALANEAGALFEQERLRLEQDTVALTRRRADLEGRRAVLEERWEEMAAPEKAPEPLRPDERERRRDGEEVLDIVVVRRRRQREHDNLVAAHRASVSAVKVELEKACAELICLPEELEERRRSTLIRVQAHRHLTSRRAALYWRALTRRHPRGPVLAVALRGWSPELPSWARADGGAQS